MKTKIGIAVNLFFLLVIVLSCSKDVLEEKPPQIISTNTLYTTTEGFEAGLNGLYSLVRQEATGFVNNNWVTNEAFMLGTDNLITNSAHSGGGFSRIAETWQDELNSTNPFLDATFAWLYEIINASNAIINQAENNEDIVWDGSGNSPDENKNRTIAEARGIRAWAYRHLTYGWGDVPLNLSEASGASIKTDWERAPVSQVREQIMSDLKFAEEHIPIEPDLPGKLTKGAIQHYLAEMYLVLDNPDSTLYWANRVINTPQYQLVTERYGVKADQPGVPYMDMFLEGNQNRQEGNTEALWVHQFAYQKVGGGVVHKVKSHASRYANYNVDGVRPFTNTVERGGRGSTRMSFSKFALELYKWPESGPVTHSDVLNFKDDRMSPYVITWFYVLKDAEGNAPYAADRLPPGYQYGDTIWTHWEEPITSVDNTKVDWPWSPKISSGVDPNNPDGGDVYGDQVYLRLAETYLLKAEAEFRLGQIGDAAETINLLRRRANAAEVTPADIDMDFILDERSRELILEEHRRWTLLRTGTWIERTRMYDTNGGGNITERDKLFPIPQTVIDANLTSDMPQNPGY